MADIKGTYDNIGTNAAAVIMMLEANLPDNVFFTFTSEEESGRCTGAKDTYEMLTQLGITNLSCIALDVTYEGYDEGMLASIENASKNPEFLHNLIDAVSKTEPDQQSYCFVRKSKKAVPDNLPDNHLQKDLGDPDEATMSYGKINQQTCSFCLPCDGFMHSNSGVTVRQPVFEGYLNTLKGMLYALTKTNEQQLPFIQTEQKTLLERTAMLIKEEESKPKPKSYSYISTYDYGNYGSLSSAERTLFGMQEDYGYQYSFEDYEYQEIIDETIMNNIEAYQPGDKSVFMCDMLAMIHPDLYDMFYTLDDYIDNRFDERDEEKRRSMIGDLLQIINPQLYEEYTNIMDYLSRSFDEWHMDYEEDMINGYVDPEDFDMY